MRMSKLPAGEFVHAAILQATEPFANAFTPIARAALHVLRQGNLMSEIVIDDPLAPTELHPVNVLAEAGEKSAGGIVTGGGGVKGDPAAAGEIRFDPTVCVAGTNDVIAGEVVVFAGEETIDFARGNAQGAQHDGHRRSK